MKYPGTAGGVRRLFLLLVLAIGGGTATLEADDWPQWRHDAARTAVSSDRLGDSMDLLWRRQYPQLEPAWPDQITQGYMTFDVAYKPVVMGKRMFVGSSLNHRLTALDTQTGREVWRFYTGGPIRLAPAAWKDNVYVASDDGYVYCLAAGDGAVKWQIRGGPDNRKIIGNNHLVGMWPVRGGPVAADGVLHFAASIWPFMGTFVHAVDAETGRRIWCTSGLADFRPAFALQGWGMIVRPGFYGSSPQGYLLVADNRLAVPQGRNMCQLFDRKSGDLLFHEVYGMHEQHNPADFWFALRAGPNVFSGRPGSAGIDIQSGKMGGRNPIGTGISGDKTLYVASGTVVEARDAQTYARLWQLRLPAAAAVRGPGSFIRAGNNLYIPGAGGRLIIVKDVDDAARNAESGSRLPDGEVWEMLAADGKLFVVTRQGSIACYGAAEASPPPAATLTDEKKAIPTDADANAAAAEVLKASGQREGYCLVLGLVDGKLAEALARSSNLNIIAIDPDARKISDLRRRVDDAGLYGARFSAHAGQPLAFGLPPYLANLVVSETMTDADLADPANRREVMRVLRPYGGAICLRRAAGGYATLVRKDGPEGSAQWSHNSADAGNTMMAYDKLVKPPLGMLWFGGPPNTPMLPRHGRGPSPTVCNGRIIVLGCNLLRAMDAYTGRLLWEAPFPGIGSFYNTGAKQMGTHETGPNYACSGDSVYVVTPDKCVELDAATGKQTRELALPEGVEKDSKWATVRVDGDVVVATIRPLDVKRNFLINSRAGAAAQYLAAYERSGGRCLWSKKAACGFRSSGVAIGGGKVYCIDALTGGEGALAKRRSIEPSAKPAMHALEAASGKELWKIDDDVFGTWLGYSAERGVLVQAGCGRGDPTALAAHKAADGSRLWRCPASAADKEPSFIGPPLLHHEVIIPQYGQVVGLTDGALRTRSDPLTGKPVAWMAAAGGCGFTHGGEHMTFHRAWSTAGYTELASPPRLTGLGGFRSGCTANMVPACGVVSVPEYTRECECQFQNKCSVGLIHDPTAEAWSFELGPPPVEGRISRLGLNFGAPGDRVSEDDTLWLDCPDVGGPSPQVQVELKPSQPSQRRDWLGNWRGRPVPVQAFAGAVIHRHASTITDGPLPWVACSGLEGVAKVQVRMLNPAPVGGKAPDKPGGDSADRPADEARYTLRLYFAELRDLKAGQRVFNVSIQGKELLTDFDIAAAAQGNGRSIVKEFQDVLVGESLTLEFTAKTGQPLICGIEAVQCK